MLRTLCLALLVAAAAGAAAGPRPSAFAAPLRPRAALLARRAAAATASMMASPLSNPSKGAPAGPAVLERKPADPVSKVRPRGKGGKKFKVLLFNDNANTREYVAEILMGIGLTEGEAFEVMMKAHRAGMGVVGVWVLELAEGYCAQLTGAGLIANIAPVDDE